MTDSMYTSHGSSGRPTQKRRGDHAGIDSSTKRAKTSYETSKLRGRTHPAERSPSRSQRDSYNAPARKYTDSNNSSRVKGSRKTPGSANVGGPKDSSGSQHPATKSWPTRSALDAKYPPSSLSVHVGTYMKDSPLPEYHAPPDLPPANEMLTQQAFTHSSVSGHESYEKLEFLGDAFIETISSLIIYTHFPTLSAGQQAQLRENLVNNENLADLAELYNFGERIRSDGLITDRKDRGPTKILADVFEAYVAAIVLSDPANGFKVVQDWVTTLWTPQLLAFRPDIRPSDDAKTKLAKLLGGKDVRLDYEDLKPMAREIGGRQRFYLGVFLSGWGYEHTLLGKGDGQSKAVAKTYAAEDALKSSGAIIDDAHKRKLEYDRKRKEEAENSK